MGWVLAKFFFGLYLWFYLLSLLSSWLAGTFNTWFLLDKVPLNAGLLTLGTILVYTSFDKFWDLSEPFLLGWKDSDTRTTTRSQFRATRTIRGCWVHCFVIGYILTILQSVQWSEGCAVDMGSVGADGFQWGLSAKAHVEELQFACEHSQTSTNRCIRKRSFKRAIKRAELHGYTHYRGQLYTAERLGTIYKGSIETAPKICNSIPSSKMKRQRFTCFNWNCSGLSPSGWDFLQQWIECQHLDIITLQETHWKHTSEWVTAHYYALHSGGGDSKAGLLSLISKNICALHDLSWQEVVPGRLMHFRIHGTDRELDFVNIYQHIHAYDRIEDRAHIWNALQTVITSCSKRNHLTLLGDWNTSLRRQSTAVGLDTYHLNGDRCAGPKHTDEHILHNILNHFDLVVLNTWDATLGPTYLFGHQSSRIDYVICRRCHSDATSKQVQYISDFPLNCPSGAHHVPQLATSLKVWHPHQREQCHGWSRAQRLELYQRWTSNTDTAVQQKCTVRDTVELLPTTGNRLEMLHNAMNNFPAPRRQSQQEAVCKYDITPFQRFPVHSKHLRDLRQPSLENLIKAWFHVTQRQRARQQMRRTSAQARRLRLQKIFDSAGRADEARDHFRLYQAIRELAPKQPYRRIQIRDSDGRLLHPEAAADRICDWFAELYHDADEEGISKSFPWPFTEQEFHQGLAQLPLLKALSPEYAPAPFWQCAARQISSFLHSYFGDCSERNCLPGMWNRGTICLLPKHTRRCHLPQELRPITLLEPCNKVLMGCLARQLFDSVGALLCSVPQYAYLPLRGCMEALPRLFKHCGQVRSKCLEHRYHVHQRARGDSLGPLAGGLLVTLDLSKAFDTVPRPRLYRCLQRLGVPTVLIDFLQAVYHETSYSFQHRGLTRSFGTSKGIRQGCKAAPILWAAYLTDILFELCKQTDDHWLYQCNTWYADDGCLHEVVTSSAQFKLTLHRIGQTLDILEDAKLSINLEKTFALMRLVGSDMNKIQKHHTQRTSNGVFLKIPRKSGTITLIKLVTHFSYLGATVNYYNFERATAMTRIKASDKTGQQLHRWLYSKKSLTNMQKYRLWNQCVFATMRYSLIAVGMTHQSAKLIDIACLKQLRRLFREPTHLTLMSNQEFLHRHHLVEPLLQLVAFCQKASERDSQRISQLRIDDILLRTEAIDYEHQMQVLTESWFLQRQRHSDRIPVQPDAQLVCPICFILLDSWKLLRKHQTEAHGTRPGALRQFTPQECAQGVPTCIRCHMKFSTFHSLAYHVQYVCMADRQDIEEVEHRVRVQELLQYARGQQLQALTENAPLLAYFHHRCALCSFFSVTTRGLYMHWQREHSAEFQRHEPINERLLPLFEHDSPCALCGATFKQYHKCHIVRQMALLLTQAGDQITPVRSALVCQHCGKVYTTRHGLLQHARRYHRAEQAVEEATALDIDMQCQIYQAVTLNACEDLLLQEDIQHFLSTRCLKCQKTYAGRRALSRHIKQNHASEWHECELRAMQLDIQWKPIYGCVCKPTMHTKHICQMYLQFILLRLDHERQMMPLLVAEPPDVILSVVEQIEPLLWLGFAQNLYSKSQLRLNLTRHCQVCGYTGLNAEDLRLHMHAIHPVHLQESQYLIEMFNWCMFMEMGCFCNPSPGWGELHHECVGLTQLALTAASYGWQVVLPWPFTSQDLIGLLGNLLPCSALQRITMALMTRNFHQLWEDTELLTMLATHCLVCQEPVAMSHIQAHLVVAHQITNDRLKYVTHQLSAVFDQISMAEERCDWCHELLHTYLDADDVMQVDVHAHLQKCPMITQLAMLLMHPRWSVPALQPLTWATQERICENRRKHELKLWQFNVSTSDTYGQSLEPVAQSGLQLMDDSLIGESVHYQCLLCSKTFFSPNKMCTHLHQQHNFLQLQTHMCYYRLALRCTDPCQFCGLKQHQQQCPALLNLAVFLINGYGIRGIGRHRLGHEDLGQPSDEGANEQFGHHSTSPSRQRSRRQAAQDRPQDRSQRSLSFGVHDHGADRSAGNLVSVGAATRGYDQQPPSEESVHAPPGDGPWECPPTTDGCQPHLASAGNEAHSSEAPDSPNHGPGTGASLEDADGGDADSRTVPGLQVLSSGEGRHQPVHAFPSLESPAQMPGTNGAGMLAHQRGAPESAEHPTIAGGPQGDPSISQSEEGSRHQRESAGSAVDLDSGTTPRPGTLARGCQIGLSQFLAAHPSASSSCTPLAKQIQKMM